MKLEDMLDEAAKNRVNDFPVWLLGANKTGLNFLFQYAVYNNSLFL